MSPSRHWKISRCIQSLWRINLDPCSCKPHYILAPWTDGNVSTNQAEVSPHLCVLSSRHLATLCIVLLPRPGHQFLCLPYKSSVPSAVLTVLQEGPRHLRVPLSDGQVQASVHIFPGFIPSTSPFSLSQTGISLGAGTHRGWDPLGTAIRKHHKINASLAKYIKCREFTFPQRLPTDTGNLILNLIRLYKQFGLFPQQSHHPGLLNVYVLFLNSLFFRSIPPPLRFSFW